MRYDKTLKLHLPGRRTGIGSLEHEVEIVWDVRTPASILEVGSWELTDLKELTFWNLDLEINTTLDLVTLNFAIDFTKQ